MGWPLVFMAISAVAGVASSIIQSRGEASAASNHSAWDDYNRNMEFDTQLGNIASRTALTGINARLAIMAGRSSSAAIGAIAAQNAKVIEYTTRYNNLILDENLSLLWDKLELDVSQIEDQRQIERGQIVGGFQSASGAVIGEGSLADVIIDQKMQEAMDVFVATHEANRGAADIANAQAQNRWQGEMEVRYTLGKANQEMKLAMTNANLRSMGMIAENSIFAEAGFRNALSAYESAGYESGLNFSTRMQGARNTFTQGIFGAASRFGESVYRNRPARISSTPSPYTSLVDNYPAETDLSLITGQSMR